MSDIMPETHVAIQGVCAWPNLTLLPDGTIIATIFNQPCHGLWEGDLDCWASTDGGLVWEFRGRPCPHEPGTNRMNCAAGLARNGDLVVLCSGWGNRPEPYGEKRPFGELLRPWVCRSSDQGRTWQRVSELPPSPSGNELVPFGDLTIADDGTLRAGAYISYQRDGAMTMTSYMLTSDDDGQTWCIGSCITEFGGEVATLSVGDRRWLAATRTPGKTTDVTDVPADRSAPEHTLKRLLNLHLSEDDGKTWRLLGPVSLSGQIPGHMLKLADGRIVLAYGNRCPNNLGIDARISRDGGASWGRPIRLADMLPGDGGYPSTIERADSKLVTAFYNKVSGAYHREMSVTRWDINDYDKAGPALGHAW